MTRLEKLDFAAYGVVGSARFLVSAMSGDEPAHVREAVRCLREDLQRYDLAKQEATEPIGENQ